MTQFDVYRNEDGPGFLLDCQHDVLSHFKTRFVVPLLPARGAQQATRLHPILTIEGAEMIMVTQLASAVGTGDLKRHVTSLADDDLRIKNALDVLITGI